MVGALDGSIAKFQRAGEQIKSLNDSMAATFKSYSYRVVVAERDRDPSYRVLRLRTEQNRLPIEWSAIIGEITHDLPSALDLLAYQLVLLNSPSNDVLRRVSFPVYLYGPRSKQSQRWRKGTGAYFKGKHRAIIRRLQPYHRRNGQRLSPLWLLHELNNADKHRLIQVARLTAERISPRRITLTRDPDDVYHSPVVRGIEIKQGVPFKDGAKVGRIGTDSQRWVEVETGITTKVVFREGCDAIRGFEVMPVLISASNTVIDTLRLFHSEFG